MIPYNILINDGALEVLSRLPSNCVDLTFTSPPYYNARNYASYGNYLDAMVSILHEVFRVTKDGRFLVLNTSPVIQARISRQHSSKRYGIPFDLHPRLVDIGWEFIDDIIWAKPVESVKNRVAGFDSNRTPLTYKANVRTEYLMVYRKGCGQLIDWNLRQYSKDAIQNSLVDDDYERSNLWEISPAHDSVHPAVFPLRLCEQIVKLYSFKNDIVMDPFAGSGTLGEASMNLGRRCLLIERNAAYVKRAWGRLHGMGLESGSLFRLAETVELGSLQ